MTSGPANEDDLIEAARQGDHEAYGRLVAAYRGELHAHCYRMLGSSADAEDALQEALVRAWRGMRGFERRGSLRAWLYTIATNACLKVIERRPRRVLPMDYGPAADPHQSPGSPPAEPVWIGPYPGQREAVADAAATPEARYDQRESVELAFIAALQHLTPRQRAALILHDVLGFPAGQIAEMLKTTPASVYSSLQRAHKAVSGRLPHPSQQATLRRLGDEGLRDIVEAYVDAWHRGDIDAIVAMLTEDAILSMPPLPSWFQGVAAVRAFLATWPMAQAGRSRLIAARANGQLAFGHYRLDNASGRYLAHSIDVLTLRGTRIAEVTAFFLPDSFAPFGLSPHAEPSPR
jgi:RNA polymerase sigma-70 factor (ECF subfamily)